MPAVEMSGGRTVRWGILWGEKLFGERPGEMSGSLCRIARLCVQRLRFVSPWLTDTRTHAVFDRL